MLAVLHSIDVRMRWQLTPQNIVNGIVRRWDHSGIRCMFSTLSKGRTVFHLNLLSCSMAKLAPLKLGAFCQRRLYAIVGSTQLIFFVRSSEKTKYAIPETRRDIEMSYFADAKPSSGNIKGIFYQLFEISICLSTSRDGSWHFAWVIWMVSMLG